MQSTIYGYSTPETEIERVLGAEPGTLARNSLDLDIADDCRSMREDGIDLNDEAAVRKWCGERYLPRWVDVLVLIAPSYTDEQ